MRKLWACQVLYSVRISRQRLLVALEAVPFTESVDDSKILYPNSSVYELSNHILHVSDEGNIDWWNKACPDKKSRITPYDQRNGCGANFVVYETDRRTMLTDFAGLSIQQHVSLTGKEKDYPRLILRYNAEGKKKGKLSFLRIDLGGGSFVNYEEGDGFIAKPNANKSNPLPKGCSASIKDNSRTMDVDSVATSMLNTSELELVLRDVEALAAHHRAMTTNEQPTA